MNYLTSQLLTKKEIEAIIKNLNKSLNLKHLSMGMSNDYEVAIQNGSTFVRVGSAIFGQRT